MKKTIIANWGHANQGKSETTKILARLILEKYPNAICDPANIDFSTDIKVIIKINDLKIGIESQGDPGSRLEQSIKEFIKVPCDLVICTTRTRGYTVDIVSSLFQSDDYDIIWVTNYRSNEKPHDLLNQISANQIFELISQILKNKI